MAYKWKPNAAQRKEYARKMNDPHERAEIEAKKEAKAVKRRLKSKFDYNKAGGNYIPTSSQYEAAAEHLGPNLTAEQGNACNIVMSGYIMNEKVHHDFIHIVNELISKPL